MKRCFSLFILPVMIALLAILFLTSLVFAQDEVPVETPVEVPAEVAGIEEVPAEELAPVLEEVTETGVTLVDESGEPLPLAVEETAEILAGGDPYYKVGTTTYYFRFIGECGTTPNCFESNFPISEAIDHISTTGLPSDGMIYVEAGTYAESAQVDPLTMDPILSGLKGLIGTVADGIPQVNLAGGIIVYDVDLGFTIKGFNCSDGIQASGVSGTLKIEDVKVTNDHLWGILITHHNGAVILNRVEADENFSGGAYINNTAGTAGVTITNSSFNNNGSDDVLYVGGLTIATKGAVSLDGVTAIGNTGGQPGLFIQQSGTISIKNSIFSNNESVGITNIFEGFSGIEPIANITLLNVIANNNSAGFTLMTKGNISLTKVTAGHNDSRGGYLETCYPGVDSCQWLGTGVVSIKDSSFDENGQWEGLLVSSRGAITLTNVSVSGTTSIVENPGGAELDNHYSQLIAPVKVTQGKFNENDTYGLWIQSRGSITLSQVSASENTGNYGALITNSYGLTSGVTVSGLATSYSQYNNNGNDGLRIVSNGAISIKYTQINDNSWGGATLLNTGGNYGVTVANSVFKNNVETNLTISSKGAIKLTTIESINSIGGQGADLHNETSISSPGVTISNAIFSDNAGYGLSVYSKGNIILSNTTGWDNQYSAALLDNSSGLGYVKISNTKSIDPNIQSGFDHNGRGVYINTFGIVALSNVNASDNDYDGIDIVNNLTKNVNLTNCRVDGNNLIGGSAGIIINGMGSIIISGGYSNNNLKPGLQIDNTSALDTAPKPVTILNFTANSNVDRGIYVLSRGAITLTNVIANDTTGASQAAIDLDNTAQTANVTLSKVKANGNVDNGIRINSKGAVKVSSSMSSDNGWYGTYINTQGAITLTNMIANENGLKGAYLSNQSSLLHAAVTVTGSTNGNSFSSNSDIGLDINSTGAVILNNITADDNGYEGIVVDNFKMGAGLGNVTVNYVYTRYNTMAGFTLNSAGNISLKGVVSMLNNGHGSYFITNNHNLSISSSIFSGNLDTGIYAQVGSNGIFSMSTTMYFGNDTDNTGEENLLIIH